MSSPTKSQPDLEQGSQSDGVSSTSSEINRASDPDTQAVGVPAAEAGQREEPSEPPGSLTESSGVEERLAPAGGQTDATEKTAPQGAPFETESPNLTVEVATLEENQSPSAEISLDSGQLSEINDAQVAKPEPLAGKDIAQTLSSEDENDLKAGAVKRPTTPDSVPEPQNVLQRGLTQIDERLEELSGAVEKFGHAGAIERIDLRKKDEIIRQLSDELRDSRKSLDTTIFRPIFAELVRLIHELNDDFHRCEKQKNEKGEGEALDFTLDRLKDARVGIEMALERIGLYAQPQADLEMMVYAPVDLSLMRVVDVIPTDNSQLHETVAKVRRPAYFYVDRDSPALRAEVVVFKFDQASEG